MKVKRPTELTDSVAVPSQKDRHPVIARRLFAGFGAF